MLRQGRLRAAGASAPDAMGAGWGRACGTYGASVAAADRIMSTEAASAKPQRCVASAMSVPRTPPRVHAAWNVGMSERP